MPLPSYYQYGDFAEFEAIFANNFKSVRYEKGDYIKPPGQDIVNICYIVKGLAKASMIHENGGVKTTFVVGKGCIQPLYYTGSFPIWEGVLTIQAYTKLRAIEISKEGFRRCAQEYPRLMEIMLNVTARSAYTLCADALNHICNEGITRICDLLYYHIVNNKVVHNHDPHLMTITQNDIGAIVGLTRVNTNKILQHLQNEKIISLERHKVRIINVNGLLKYCSQDLSVGE
jgi:CRP-like cAMP-binding protein